MEIKSMDSFLSWLREKVVDAVDGETSSVFEALVNLDLEEYDVRVALYLIYERGYKDAIEVRK